METAGFITTAIPALLPVSLSDMAALWAMKMEKDPTISKGCCHYGVMYSFNGLTNVIMIALQPLVSLVALVAAGVFKVISCCTDDPDVKESAEKFSMLGLVAASFILGIYVEAIRIVYPKFQPAYFIDKIDGELKKIGLDLNTAQVKKEYGLES